MNELCDYPNCPSGINTKLLDERHQEVKVHLTNIETNQREMIEVVKNVATLLAEVNNIKLDMAQNVKDHDEIFTRLRKSEAKIAWFAGSATAIITLIEGLRAFGIIR